MILRNDIVVRPMRGNRARPRLEMHHIFGSITTMHRIFGTFEPNGPLFRRMHHNFGTCALIPPSLSHWGNELVSEPLG